MNADTVDNYIRKRDRNCSKYIGSNETFCKQTRFCVVGGSSHGLLILDLRSKRKSHYFFCVCVRVRVRVHVRACACVF